MSPEVSIVTPVFNGEKFIKKFLDSLIAQTFENWECIIVNDGSTDNTLSIIEEYTAQDTRFSYFTIPNSGAPKTPRDLAISKAQGEWIIPVDADDLIDNHYVQEMISRAIQSTADIVLPQMYFFKANRIQEPLHILPLKDFDKSQIISGEDAFTLTFFDVKIGTNGALIKRALFKHLTQFNTGINFLRADEYDTRELLLNASKVAFANAIYYYRQHNNEVTKKISPNSFEYLMTDSLLEKLAINRFGVNSPQVKQVRKHRVLGIVSRKVLWIRYRYLFNDHEKKDIRDLMNKYTKEIKKRYYFNISVYKKIIYFAQLQRKLNK